MCTEFSDIVPNSKWSITLTVITDDVSVGTVDLWVYAELTETTVHKTQADGTLSNSNHSITFQLTEAETLSLYNTDNDTYPDQIALVTLERNGEAFTPVGRSKITYSGLS